MTRLGPEWRKSRRSDSNGGCVELRKIHDGQVEMRDSVDPTGPTLGFSYETFAAFIDDVKAGRLDL
jgi:hypothetical protein